MDDRDYELNQDSGRNPWDPDFYGTGSTCPPKSHRGLFALVLVSGILLGGILTALGGINARIVREWSENQEEDTLPVSLHAGDATGAAEDTLDLPKATVSTAPGEAAVVLQPTPQSVDTPTQEGGLPLQEIYEKCIDSTVSIICTLSSGTSSGSGVVLSGDGYLITNCHVVEGAEAIRVLLTDGRELDAQLVGSDKLSDLAVLYVEAEGLQAAQFGDSDTLRVGDMVVAIGDSLGVELRGTMTDGIVSAINRDITTEGRTLTLIQTNAALNSGNSGGPLINCYGQVIGINTMKIGDYVSSAGVEGLGFAIPSTTVKEIVDQLISQGYVSGRPGLGIEGTDVPEFYQHYYRLPAGVYVTAVTGEAAQKGVQMKDILIYVDGERVTTTDDIQTILYSHEVGDTVEAIFYRSGQQYRVSLILDESTS